MMSCNRFAYCVRIDTNYTVYVVRVYGCLCIAMSFSVALYVMVGQRWLTVGQLIFLMVGQIPTHALP